MKIFDNLKLIQNFNIFNKAYLANFQFLKKKGLFLLFLFLFLKIKIFKNIMKNRLSFEVEPLII